jgi:outer membrane protein TolC
MPLKAATAAETAAHKSLEITHKRLLLEEVNYVALLNAEQTYLQSTLARVQAQANRYVDTAELYQALGGGWWNRRILRKLFKMQMHPTRYDN